MSLVQWELNECIKPRFPWTVINKDKDIEVSIGLQNSTLFVTFCGSLTLKDWLYNFRFWKKPYKRMNGVWLAHAGFVSIWKEIEPYVQDYVKTHVFTSVEIRGYSHGGALAQLCHEWFMFQKEQNIIQCPVATVVAGASRVFSIFGYRHIKERCKGIMRYQFRSDGVCSLPPAILGYKHVGIVGQVGKRNINPLRPQFIYDHDATNYLNWMHTEDHLPNNWAYPMVMKVYGWIYLFLMLLACGLAGMLVSTFIGF
jgi:hypothetical protein